MRILLIGNYLPDRQKSMSLFAMMLARELSNMGHEVKLVMPAQFLMPSKVLSNRFLKWVGYFDKFVIYPLLLKKLIDWAQVVHVCDHSNAMYVPRKSKKPFVVTCHDVIAIQAAKGLIPGWRVGVTGRLFQKLIFSGLGRADAVACVSDLTRRDLTVLNGSSSEKVTTVLNGINGRYDPEITAQERIEFDAKFSQAQGKYVLHVGSDLPRKNRLSVLRIFEKLLAGSKEPLKLIFVGPPLSQAMKNFVEESKINLDINCYQSVSNNELRIFYASAFLMLFPSTHEGFGWPVIEAQACGCPVVTSNLAPMNEIGSDAAIYIDPADAEGAAAVIMEKMHEFPERSKAGIANAMNYSPSIMAKSYERLYIKVTGHAG